MKKAMITVRCSERKAEELSWLINDITQKNVVMTYEEDHAHIMCNFPGISVVVEEEKAMKFLSKEKEPIIIGSRGMEKMKATLTAGAKDGKTTKKEITIVTNIHEIEKKVERLDELLKEASSLIDELASDGLEIEIQATPCVDGKAVAKVVKQSTFIGRGEANDFLGRS